MTVSELIARLRAIVDAGASMDSVVLLEGYDLEGDELIQANVLDVMTEGRCEEDGELQAVYLRFDEAAAPEPSVAAGDASKGEP